jgi:hydrogenase maturation protein HypF
VDAFTAAAKTVGRETGVKAIVLSGGVFNNDFIFTRMIIGLEKEGFTVYTHTQVPTGDGGISLGQAVVAAALEG